jgi:ATP-dependent Clp protease ATP-binding subunit ClpC
MFERYTETARRVIFFARYVASQVGSPYIESDHLLMGLLVADQGLAARFFGSPWAAEEIWKRVEQNTPMRESISVSKDLPLANECKRVMAYGWEEAFRLSDKHIGSEHLLLGLFREEKCLAAQILRERGLDLTSVRDELALTPHKDSVAQKFVRETGSRPAEVAELQNQLASITSRMKEAIGNQDLAKARVFSEEERTVRDKLRPLYRQYGLSDWLWR